MRRFFVPSEELLKETAVLKDGEAHHIIRVLRLRPGEKVILFDGYGRQSQGTIIEISKGSVRIRQDELIRQDEEPFRISIGQALLKAHKMDLIIQKATELGIHAVYPFFTERSVPIGSAGHFEKKRVRWQKIALEAAKQCGRTTLPDIQPVQPLPLLLRACQANDLKLILWEKASDISLKDTFRKAGIKNTICALIGPEGGLSDEEAEAAIREGFMPVGLGHLILRAETASLAMMTIIRYESGF